MDKEIGLGVPVTPQQVSQYEALHNLLSTRVEAIFRLWKIRRENTTARWAIDRDWSHIEWWCIGVDQQTPGSGQKVLAEIHIDYECTEHWDFPLDLLSLEEEALEAAVATVFKAWVNEERKRQPKRPTWKWDAEPWEYDEEMEPQVRLAFQTAEKAKWGDNP